MRHSLILFAAAGLVAVFSLGAAPAQAAPLPKIDQASPANAGVESVATAGAVIALTVTRGPTAITHRAITRRGAIIMARLTRAITAITGTGDAPITDAAITGSRRRSQDN